MQARHHRLGSASAHAGTPAARHLVTTIALLVLVAAVALGLEAALGRMGERIATQLCVSLTAIVALGLFSGNSGIVSFGHAAFMGFGAYLSGILTMPAGLQRSGLPMLPTFLAGWELSLPFALLVVLAAGFLVALLLGLPIARLAGASATIATLGLLIIMHSLLVGARELTRGSQTFFGVPREVTFEVALAAAAVFIVVALAWKESRGGLMLRAVRDSEPAARAVGVDPWRSRLVGWAVSGALATVAGALYGHMLGAFSPRDFYFGLTFAMVAMLIVGGLTTVTGAVVGTIAITLLQDGVRQFENGFIVAGLAIPPIFGLTTAAVGVAILLVIFFRPEGLFGRSELRVPPLERLLARLLPPLPAPAPAPSPPADPPVLVTEGLTRRFQGLTAVDDVSLTIAPGRITGLIGPNGAGKSTLVNLLSGHIAPTAGRISFGDRDLTGLPAQGIARAGLARTFQNNRLFDRLTVRENVAVAAIGVGASRRDAAARAERELVAMNLLADAERSAGALPYGARKRLDIARCLATEPTLLLLDEPAAGMNPEETHDLGRRIAAVAAERGIAVVLIDHDLEFVNRLSSEIVVMNRGRLLARGTPEDIRLNPAVIEAYIGTGRSAGPETTTTTRGEA